MTYDESLAIAVGLALGAWSLLANLLSILLQFRFVAEDRAQMTEVVTRVREVSNSVATLQQSYTATSEARATELKDALAEARTSLTGARDTIHSLLALISRLLRRRGI